MVNLVKYVFQTFNIEKITPKYSSIYEVFKSENICTSTKQVFTLLGDKYKTLYLNKVMKYQCNNLTEDKHEHFSLSLTRLRSPQSY